jgi:hypothetical protein
VNERLVVEHLTGNIPLLLNCLIDVETFNEAAFMRSPVLHKVHIDVETFFRQKQAMLMDSESKTL